MPIASHPEISPAHFSSKAQIEAVLYTSVSQCDVHGHGVLSTKMLCFSDVLYGIPGLATEEKRHKISNF